MGMMQGPAAISTIPYSTFLWDGRYEGYSCRPQDVFAKNIQFFDGQTSDKPWNGRHLECRLDLMAACIKGRSSSHVCLTNQDTQEALFLEAETSFQFSVQVIVIGSEQLVGPRSQEPLASSQVVGRTFDAINQFFCDVTSRVRPIGRKKGLPFLQFHFCRGCPTYQEKQHYLWLVETNPTV